MFLIRSVKKSDYQDLLALARELNTVNLPGNADDIRKMIRRSEQSFSGKIPHDSPHAQYLFVMENTRTGRAIGTSKIHARHGTVQKPHVYFQVGYENMASKSLQVRFKRKVYRLRWDTKGYTEIGGLVLQPRYRKHKAHLGRQLSLIRFILMRAHPSWFCRRVIAELLPPLPGGRSRLWDFYGYQLTRIPYHQADRLSYHNKEFILKLFPKTDLYHDLLPRDVQQDMEQTGPGSTAAKHSLERIGFRYAQQIDPFDGGPYYVASRVAISVYRKTQRKRFGGMAQSIDGREQLVFTEAKDGIRALLTPTRLIKKSLYLPSASADCLGLLEGDSVYTYNWKSMGLKR